MKQSAILFLTILLSRMLLTCQGPQQVKDYINEETPEEYRERMKWWHDATFGMFIHWGVYSVPAGIHRGEEIPGNGEWIMDKADIPAEEYEEFARQFNPVEYDARGWVQIARDAGMKYIVITSKHHDGFCLWDSEVTDYDIIDFTPFKRDILKELADACTQAGIRLCFYHSIMDWHHPDASGDNFPEYRERYLKSQLKELLSGAYGDIGVLWFDGEWISAWTEEQGKELYNYARNLKPGIIINNRVGKGRQGMQGMNRDAGYAGDFGTPEQEILDSRSDLSWEACMTMNDTWGYKNNDHNWKSTGMLIHNLIDIVSKGGNYLLNVGPDSRGAIPQESVKRLREMGAWLEVNGQAVYAAKTTDPYRQGDFIRFTVSPDEEYLYVISMSWPGETLETHHVVPTEGSEIFMLGYGEALEWHLEGDRLIVSHPPEMKDEDERPCGHAWVYKIRKT